MICITLTLKLLGVFVVRDAKACPTLCKDVSGNFLVGDRNRSGFRRRWCDRVAHIRTTLNTHVMADV